MGVAVTFQSKMAASSTSIGGIVKERHLELDPKLKQIARAVNQRPSHIRTHGSITAI